MITYTNCIFINGKKGLSEFVEGFISEIYALEDNEKNKWKGYEEHKKILKSINPSSREYEIAIRAIVNRLGI